MNYEECMAQRGPSTDEARRCLLGLWEVYHDRQRVRKHNDPFWKIEIRKPTTGRIKNRIADGP
jgi:hypothetical protein